MVVGGASAGDRLASGAGGEQNDEANNSELGFELSRGDDNASLRSGEGLLDTTGGKGEAANIGQLGFGLLLRGGNASVRSGVSAGEGSFGATGGQGDAAN